MEESRIWEGSRESTARMFRQPGKRGKAPVTLCWLLRELPSSVSWTHSIPSAPCAQASESLLTLSWCFITPYLEFCLVFHWLGYFSARVWAPWALSLWRFSLWLYTKCLPIGRLQSDLGMTKVEVKLGTTRNFRKFYIKSNPCGEVSLWQVSFEGPT